MEMKVEIKNINQIRMAFMQAPAKMASNLNKAIHKSIFLIQGKSMIATPVLTGRLRASHTTLFGNLKGEVGPTAYYGIFVHEGTKFMKGRPFLRNAVESSDFQVQGYFKDAVQDTLDDIGRQV